MSPDGTLLTLAPSKTPLAAGHELASGEGAPRFAGKGLDGEPIDLAGEKDKWKYVLLHFWASDEKCLEQFAEMNRVAARYKNDGLRIIGVNLDSDRETALRSVRGGTAVSAVLRRERAKWPTGRSVQRCQYTQDIRGSWCGTIQHGEPCFCCRRGSSSIET